MRIFYLGPLFALHVERTNKMEAIRLLKTQLYKTIRYRGAERAPIKSSEDWLPQSPNISIDDLKSYVNWSIEDFGRLKLLSKSISKNLDHIVDVFYSTVVDNKVALEVINNSGSSVEVLKTSLKKWIMHTVENDIDENEFAEQNKIGVRHVQVNLPQPFMVMGINVINKAIKEIIFDQYKDNTKMIEKTVESLDKSLNIRLSMMLRSYQDDRDRLLKDNVLSENESILALGRMSASIAHEIKNPLAGISGAIQVLKDKLSGESEDGQLMEAILEQVHRMSGTVKDLLDFARPVQLNLQKIRFSEIIDSLKSLLSADPHFKMEILYADKAIEDLELNVDPVRLQSVFYNLFVNANEAVKEESGQITLSSEVNKKGTSIYVEDTGPGIPEEWVAELFKPFATNKTHGTGLGLAICSKIVESHGGVIAYAPQGEGACFCISLPKSER